MAFIDSEPGQALQCTRPGQLLPGGVNSKSIVCIETEVCCITRSAVPSYTQPSVLSIRARSLFMCRDWSTIVRGGGGAPFSTIPKMGHFCSIDFRSINLLYTTIVLLVLFRRIIFPTIFITTIVWKSYRPCISMNGKERICGSKVKAAIARYFRCVCQCLGMVYVHVLVFYRVLAAVLADKVP